MFRSAIKTLACLGVVAILLTATACDDGLDLPTDGAFQEEPSFSRAPNLPPGEPLKVLTRNVYLGGDTDLVFQADMNDLAAVYKASAMVWAQVQASKFPERAVSLVDEIQKGMPHIVTLQEIPLFVILNGFFQKTGEVDFLEILQMELQDRGLPYHVEAVQNNTNAVMPVELDAGYNVVQWISFTDRIAVLVRDDFSIVDRDQGTYGASFPLSENLELLRGWIRVSAEVDGIPYHFVSTHLEVQSLDFIQEAQTAELLGSVMSGLDGITVLTGDLNSDAEAGPGAPSWTETYETLIAAGFQDAWILAHPGAAPEGLTCCQAKTLDNAESALDERIDFVLLRSDGHRGSPNRLPGRIQVEVVGEETSDRTASSDLWPSDHAGLLATFHFPAPLFKDF